MFNRFVLFNSLTRWTLWFSATSNPKSLLHSNKNVHSEFVQVTPSCFTRCMLNLSFEMLLFGLNHGFIWWCNSRGWGRAGWELDLCALCIWTYSPSSSPEVWNRIGIKLGPSWSPPSLALPFTSVSHCSATPKEYLTTLDSFILHQYPTSPACLQASYTMKCPEICLYSNRNTDISVSNLFVRLEMRLLRQFYSWNSFFMLSFELFFHFHQSFFPPIPYPKLKSSFWVFLWCLFLKLGLHLPFSRLLVSCPCLVYFGR